MIKHIAIVWAIGIVIALAFNYGANSKETPSQKEEQDEISEEDERDERN